MKNVGMIQRLIVWPYSLAKERRIQLLDAGLVCITYNVLSLMHRTSIWFWTICLLQEIIFLCTRIFC